MEFGQSWGPPASHNQMRELTELLQAAGHSDFRDARGPMGFTQRQANGKFTRDEAASAFSPAEESPMSAEHPTPLCGPAPNGLARSGRARGGSVKC